MDTIIHSPYGGDATAPTLYTGKVVQGAANEIESFTFSIFPDNPGFYLIQPLTTKVSVYDTHTDEYEFTGRILTTERSMDSSGLVTLTCVAESQKGYLCDSIAPSASENSYSVQAVTEILLQNHNSLVDEDKQISFDMDWHVTHEVPTSIVTVEMSFGKTWDTLKSALDEAGVEMELRTVDGKIYLHLAEELGEHSKTEIRLAKNMLSVSHMADPTSCITRLVPLGANGLTIADVYGGRAYIDDMEAREQYGTICGTVEWDTSDPIKLLTNAIEYLRSSNAVYHTYTIQAYDLSLIGLDPDEIKRYCYYHVINELTGLDEELRVSKKTIDVVQPHLSTVEIAPKTTLLNPRSSTSVISQMVDLEKVTSGTETGLVTLADYTNSLSERTRKLEEGDDYVETLTWLDACLYRKYEEHDTFTPPLEGETIIGGSWWRSMEFGAEPDASGNPQTEGYMSYACFDVTIENIQQRRYSFSRLYSSSYRWPYSADDILYMSSDRADSSSASVSRTIVEVDDNGDTVQTWAAGKGNDTPWRSVTGQLGSVTSSMRIAKEGDGQIRYTYTVSFGSSFPVVGDTKRETVVPEYYETQGIDGVIRTPKDDAVLISYLGNAYSREKLLAGRYCYEYKISSVSVSGYGFYYWKIKTTKIASGWYYDKRQHVFWTPEYYEEYQEKIDAGAVIMDPDLITLDEFYESEWYNWLGLPNGQINADPMVSWG